MHIRVKTHRLFPDFFLSLYVHLVLSLVDDRSVGPLGRAAIESRRAGGSGSVGILMASDLRAGMVKRKFFMFASILLAFLSTSTACLFVSFADPIFRSEAPLEVFSSLRL